MRLVLELAFGMVLMLGGLHLVERVIEGVTACNAGLAEYCPR